MHSFLLLITPLYGYSSFCLLISLVGGHVGCFHSLVVLDLAAMNICVQFLCGHLSLFLLGIYIQVKLLGPRVTLMFIQLLRNCQTISKTAAQF